VIGGGPAGSAAAATLAGDGRSVLLLVEPRPARTRGVGEGAPPGLDRAVDDVFGPATFVPTDHLRSLGNRAAWGSDELLATDFMFNPFGCGWHLDRVAFDDRLLAAAMSTGATVAPAAEVSMDTAIVIDATGRRAEHARRHGARRVARDRLTAVVAVYRDAGGDATTTVEAAVDGWWYTCPVPGGRRVVAFLTDGDLLEPALRSTPGFDARARATAHVGPLLAAGHRAAPVVVAAGTARLDPPVGPGWSAAGDAAASFDPLSSQGLLTAVLMGREAARHTEDRHAYADRYHEIVATYERERRAMYRREERWPTAPFWLRRHAGG